MVKRRRYIKNQLLITYLFILFVLFLIASLPTIHLSILDRPLITIGDANFTIRDMFVVFSAVCGAATLTVFIHAHLRRIK